MKNLSLSSESELNAQDFGSSAQLDLALHRSCTVPWSSHQQIRTRKQIIKETLKLQHVVSNRCQGMTQSRLLPTVLLAASSWLLISLFGSQQSLGAVRHREHLASPLKRNMVQD